MRLVIVAGLTLFAWAVLAAEIYAQKGMGDRSGVARLAVKPEVVSLSGTVLEVETGPCEKTTGRSTLGTHFLLETPDGESLNIHLGPAVDVKFVAKALAVGSTVSVEAFRTAKMPENHYTAQSVTSGDRTLVLRDENLRPVWAGRDAVGARSRPQRSSEFDRSYGRGYGGYGRGWGYGRGYRWGWGRGAGRGPGFGPGWAFVDENRNGICDNYERR